MLEEQVKKLEGELNKEKDKYSREIEELQGKLE
jgi:hypothetical protein